MQVSAGRWCGDVVLVAYIPASRYRRTAAERADQLLSWQRSDKAFFAAGACHVLAWAFLQRYPAAGFAPVGLQESGEPVVSHVYVGDGRRAFDHDGWTLEDELLTVTRAATASQTPGTLVERLALPGELTAFCARHNSRLPSQYAFDPWPRALAYIARFEPPDAQGRSLHIPDAPLK